MSSFEESSAIQDRLDGQGSMVTLSDRQVEANELMDPSINEKLQEIVFDHYESFIVASNCTSDIVTDLDLVETKLDDFIAKMPCFIQRLNKISRESDSLTRRWKEASLMLAKHPNLLEILEVNQLMETCIRNNCYQEAIELYNYINRLNNRYGNDIPIISNIAKEAEKSADQMLSQLLKQLHSNIQLPQCLQSVNFIRHLNRFNETQLRLVFLTARDSHLGSLIKEIPTANALIHISKLVELSRVHIFDTVTQYNAVFADDEPIVVVKYNISTVSYSPSSDRDFNDSTILSSWINHKVSEFLDILKHDLNKCVESSFGHHYAIENIIDPTFYFGLTMSRIGADFRPQLIPLFSNAILRRYGKIIEAATNNFKKFLENYSLPTKRDTVTPSSQEVPEGIQNDPPALLLEFAPLAFYCNGLLTGLNEIRLMTPIALFRDLRDILEKNLLEATNAVLKYYKSEETGLIPTEHDVLLRFCDRYANELIPHIQKCLNTLCSVQKISKVIGISVLEFTKLKDPTSQQLDTNKITEPLNSILSKNLDILRN